MIRFSTFFIGCHFIAGYDKIIATSKSNSIFPLDEKFTAYLLESFIDENEMPK